MRAFLLPLLLCLTTACSADDLADHTPFDAGDRVDQPRNDTGWRLIDASVHDSGPLLPADAGEIATDAGIIFEEDAGPTTDAGRVDDAGTPPLGPITRGPGHRLTARRFICAGEEFTRVDLGWSADGALTRVTFHEVGESIATFRVETRDGQPLSAVGTNDFEQMVSGQWQWSATDRLSAAQSLDGDGILSWNFTYNATGQLTLFGSTYEIDGDIEVEDLQIVWGDEGPTDWGAAAIAYHRGRPTAFGQAALTYDGDRLAGVPGLFELSYNAEGLLEQVDMGEGCGFHFTWEAGPAQWFLSSLPIDGIGGLYDAEGRYAGDFSPGQNLFLSMMLLGAE
jgi:hypothetical protein